MKAKKETLKVRYPGKAAFSLISREMRRMGHGVTST